MIKMYKVKYRVWNPDKERYINCENNYLKARKYATYLKSRIERYDTINKDWHFYETYENK
jgi:hypothetical protein